MKKVSYREYSKAIMGINSKLENVMIINISRDGDPGNADPVEMGVNWYSIGSVSTERAAEFAKELTEAIDLAKNFPYNGYEIEY